MCEKAGNEQEQGNRAQRYFEGRIKKHWKAPRKLIFIPDEDYHRVIETSYSYQLNVGS